MLASGWGRVGEIYYDLYFGDGRPVEALKRSGVNRINIPSFLRKKSVKATYATGSPADFLAKLENKYALFLWQPKLPITIEELERLGLDAHVARSLREAVSRGNNEAQVVAAFIYALSQASIGANFSRSFKRAILKHWKQLVQSHAIDIEMQAGLASVTLDSWNWQSQVLVG